MAWRNPGTRRAYLLAIALVGLSSALRFGAVHLLGPDFPFPTFYPAIVLTAILGGLGPGLVAVALSTLVTALPPNGMQLSDPVDLLALGMFVVMDVAMVLICAAFRRARESERCARQELERVGKIKDEFLAIVSHELRTPLAAILGWTHLLQEHDVAADEIAEGLDAIERNAQAQSQIVSDLLDMSRIVSDKVRLSAVPCDLVEIVDAGLQTVKLAATGREITLVRKVDATDAIVVRADADRLQQVIWNLLSNAIKFTPPGGFVTLSVSRAPDGKQVLVTVQDTGSGISAEFLPHVFEKFRQESASVVGRQPGLGLGLAIVKQLVERHGGTIAADSAGPGTGSTFTLTLPLCDEPLPKPQATFTSALPDRRRAAV